LPRPRWLVAALSVVAMFVFAFLASRMWSPAAKPSPDALRWYQEGMNALRDGTYYKASKSLERAVALAPRYAMAHAHLAEAWLELDLTDKARDEMLRAIPPGTRPRLPPEDESYLDAVHLTLTGDYPGAIEKYKEIQKQTPTPDAYVDLGRAYEKSEDIKDALASYQEAAKRGPQFAAAFLRSGVLYARSQNAAAATTAFDQAETLYRALNNIEGITEVIYQRALATTSAHPQEAKALAERAIATAHAAGNTNQEVTAMLTLASAEYWLGDSVDGQKTALQAVDTARKEGLENLTTRGLMQVETASQVKGDAEGAVKYFKESIDNARRFKSVRNEMRSSLALASALIQEDKVDECLKALGPALEFYQKGGYRVYTSQALLILIRAKMELADYAGALQGAQDQLQVAQQLSNRQISFGEQAVGGALSALDRFPEAAVHYQQSLAVAEEMGDKNGVGYAQKNLAAQYGRLGRYQEASDLLERALISSNESGGDRALSAQVHGQLARMALSRFQFDQANREAKQALTGPPDTARDLEAHAVLAVSAALSGKKRDAIQESDTALQLSQRATSLQAEAWLASAMVRLGAGEARAALDAASRAQKDFATHSQIESEWRAWAVSALAAKAAGDHTLAKDDSNAAANALAAVAKAWSAEAYKSYLGRPDVQRYRKQLAHI
jgi:tetratricopeptide (TPR) repeat protein